MFGAWTPLLDLAAIVAIVVGTLFSVAGVAGYVRLPDVYTRLHAAGKVSVFGVVLLLAATMASTPVGFGRVLLLMAALVLSGPVVTHALASAAYRRRYPVWRAEEDRER